VILERGEFIKLEKNKMNSSEICLYPKEKMEPSKLEKVFSELKKAVQTRKLSE